MQKSNKISLIFRHHDGNLLTMPVLYNLVETAGLQKYYSLIPAGSFEEISLHLKTTNAAVVVYSFMTPHMPWVLDEIKQIRKHINNTISIIGGGPHLVGDPLSGFKLGFDAVSAGEGESTFPHMLMDYLEQNNTFKQAIYWNGPANKFNMDVDDSIKWIRTSDTLIDLDKSFPISNTIPMMSPLEITRGCLWHCKFCQTSNVQPRHRSMKAIQVYLDELKTRGYHSRVGFICPSGFEYGAERPGICNLDLVEEVLHRAGEIGIRHIEYGVFPSELRPNTITAQAMKLLARYASNRKVTIGAQSGSNSILKRFKRGHNTEIIERAVAITKEAGFTPVLDFILGFPGETDDERMATIEFARDLNNRFHARTQMHFFMPLSGTDLQEEMPAFFGEHTIKLLEQANKDGVTTNWWKEGMRLSREIVELRGR
ncbi:TIGR04013 family B12-binding domain/radical SAM domain-containing protein [bacterium]|nr:TIGR04013 family B12-binding domain/radical SAM domain-containing protein [bacterium]